MGSEDAKKGRNKSRNSEAFLFRLVSPETATETKRSERPANAAVSPETAAETEARFVSLFRPLPSLERPNRNRADTERTKKGAPADARSKAVLAILARPSRGGGRGRTNPLVVIFSFAASLGLFVHRGELRRQRLRRAASIIPFAAARFRSGFFAACTLPPMFQLRLAACHPPDMRLLALPSVCKCWYCNSMPTSA